MPRLKTLKIGILNIAVHPHPNGIYIELFKDLAQIEGIYKIFSSDYGTFGDYNYINTSEPAEGIYGNFFRFLNIDPAAPWTDISRKQAIESVDGEPAFDIPRHMKPNHENIPFIFYPIKHRLFFDRNSISGRQFQRLLTRMFSNQTIIEKYGQVDVTVESSEDAIESILRIPALTFLEIKIKRPNSDDTSSIKQDIIDRMEEENTRENIEILKTKDKENGISPSSYTIAKMDLARSNGSILGIGYDESRRIEESTQRHEFIDTEIKYDPSRDSFFQILIRRSLQLIQKF